MKCVFALVILAASAVHSEALRVTVYDKAQLPGPVMETVSGELRRIFREAGINLELVSGHPTAAEGSLVVFSAPANPTQQRYATCHARRDIALEITAAPPGLNRAVLGIAHPLASTGLNVQVFADHISSAALQNNHSYGSLLAHAIAHEIGHVLLRSDAHETYGIMADVWTNQQYKLMAYSALFFTREQARRMHATLAGKGCDGLARIHHDIVGL
jgi:hypothetical protein